MNLKTLLPLLLAVVVFSCKPKVAPESRPKDFVWHATDCSDGSPGMVLCPYSFLRLYDNGSFTGGALRGYVAGKWRLDSATNQIWLQPGKTSATEEDGFTVFQVLEQKPGNMQVKVIKDFEILDEEDGETMQLRALPVPFENDPFRTDMNLWREKPASPESPAQLKERVKDYLQFLQMFYRFAAENDLERPDTDWFPNPMKMESPGAITMAYAHELKDWNACFFNEEQAVEAYKIISGPFMQVTLKGNPDLNERNADVVAQILDQLNNAAKK